jgi:putative hydrolase of the HAD superfamily
VVKGITVDLWDTLITDGHTMEHARDEKRADMIMRMLNLNESYRTKIMDFFVELVASFKCPLERNEWALLPYTQLEHLFNLLGVEVSDAQFEQILKIYTEEALDILPKLIEADVRETLLSLKNRYKIALISNTGRTPGSVLRKILSELNLLDVFDALIFSDEVHLRKPNAQIFLLACEKLGVKPKETVHIGDSVNIDFLGARDAGLKAIQFLPDKNRSAMHPLVETLKDVHKVIEAYYD